MMWYSPKGFFFAINMEPGTWTIEGLMDKFIFPPHPLLAIGSGRFDGVEALAAFDDSKMKMPKSKQRYASGMGKSLGHEAEANIVFRTKENLTMKMGWSHNGDPLVSNHDVRACHHAWINQIFMYLVL